MRKLEKLKLESHCLEKYIVRCWDQYEKIAIINIEYLQYKENHKQQQEIT